MSGDEVSRLQAMRDRLRGIGQDHVLAHAGELSPNQLGSLLDQLEALDLDLIHRLASELKDDGPIAALDLERIEPPPRIEPPRSEDDRRRLGEAIEIGERRLREGRLAAFVVAGGQGTRLGFDGPKGCFPIGPVSGCSLFAWHFAKVLAIRRRFGAAVPMMVMTSAANHESTVAYLRENRFFGLPEEDVLVFQQGMLPAVDEEGKLLLESPYSLSLAPDGHGGSLLALSKSKALDELKRRGIEDIFYFQVDNPLVRVLDPAFIGHHVMADSEASSKAVAKRDAGEKVGVFAMAGGHLGVVEYSDLPERLAEETEPDGRLRFRDGNIAVHLLRREFVERLTAEGLSLPYHRARKTIRALAADGRGVEERRCVKFETFVFDALPRARNPIVVETLREEEFSPVKNASGADSPEQARRDMCRMFRRWIEAAGFGVSDALAEIEIAPTYALDANELAWRLRDQRLFPERRLLMA